MVSVLELLVHSHKVDESTVANLRRTLTEEEVLRELVAQGELGALDLASAIAEKHNLAFVSLKDYPVNPSTIAIVPANLCRKYGLIAVAQSGLSLIHI
jgi:hypothetical protein